MVWKRPASQVWENWRARPSSQDSCQLLGNGRAKCIVTGDKLRPLGGIMQGDPKVLYSGCFASRERGRSHAACNQWSRAEKDRTGQRGREGGRGKSRFAGDVHAQSRLVVRLEIQVTGGRREPKWSDSSDNRGTKAKGNTGQSASGNAAINLKKKASKRKKKVPSRVILTLPTNRPTDLPGIFPSDAPDRVRVCSDYDN